jgi:hypothetical protein
MIKAGEIIKMTDESVFIVFEIWLNPGNFSDFKVYRQKTMDILIKYNAEYIYHGHPFEWVNNPDNDMLPTGIEIFHFRNIEDAQNVLKEINNPSLKADELKIFDKIRCYISKYAISGKWENSI